MGENTAAEAMTLALSDTNRARLAALLGMMGSDHDGEALNAARLADRMVRRMNLSWHELLEPRYEVAAPTARPSAEWRQRINDLLSDYSHCLTEWEFGFCLSIQRRTFLSEKQIAVLDRIWAKATHE